MKSGQRWAYTGVALGATVSVAANIAHSYVAPEDAPENWSPELGAVLGAAFWPLALAVSSEVLARNEWAGRRRVLGIGGVVVVAAVAAVVSYLHLKGLLAHYGEPELTATIGPLAVDGLMLTSTVALIGSGDRASTVTTSTVALSPAPVEVTDAGPGSPPPAEVAPGRPHSEVGAPGSTASATTGGWGHLTSVRSGSAGDPPERPEVGSPGESRMGPEVGAPESSPTSTQVAHPKRPTPNDDERYAELGRLAKVGQVDPTSATSIKRRLGVGQTRAQALRDRWADERQGDNDDRSEVILDA